jgi:hypothetical protein
MDQKNIYLKVKKRGYYSERSLANVVNQAAIRAKINLKGYYSYP